MNHIIRENRVTVSCEALGTCILPGARIVQIEGGEFLLRMRHKSEYLDNAMDRGTELEIVLERWEDAIDAVYPDRQVLKECGRANAYISRMATTYDNAIEYEFIVTSFCNYR